VAITFLIFGVVQAVLEDLREYGLMYNLASQMKHVQQRYFEAVFRQEMAWHDQQQATDLTDRLLSRLDRIQPAYNSNNFGIFLLTVFDIVSALILSLIESWRLTLIVCSVYPLVYLAFVWIAHVINQSSELGIKAFTAGTHIVSEDVGLIRTIRALCTQHLEARRWVNRVWLSLTLQVRSSSRRLPKQGGVVLVCQQPPVLHAVSDILPGHVQFVS
jgi:ABC-type bacteriocin/lantibiotic exporter with double-glycine peptidase domain